MIRYITRFENGKLIYIAYDENQEIGRIYEHSTTLIGGYSVVRMPCRNNNRATEFTTLEAAQTFLENMYAVKQSQINYYGGIV